MSDKVYNGTVKAVMKDQEGRRKVILSITGIGDAFIGWNRTPQGVSFPIGAKIQVQMYKHKDGRWLVSEIVKEHRGWRLSLQTHKWMGIL